MSYVPRAYQRRRAPASRPSWVPRTPVRSAYKRTAYKAKPRSGVALARTQNSLLHTPLLPVSKYGLLPYYDNATLTAPANNLATAYVFTANGLYDPNITGTGHQPMGFDQMMLFYEHYCATRVKVTVNWVNTDIDDTAVVGILVAPDATIEATPSKLNENGMLVKKFVQPNGSGSNHTSMSIVVDLSKVNGKRSVTNEDDFRGDSASNPVEQSYIHLFAYNSMSANTIALTFEVILEYTAKFTEPRKMTQS